VPFTLQCQAMRRRVFTVLSALSLVVCLAAAALWLRSYSIKDSATLSWQTRVTSEFSYNFEAESNYGSLRLHLERTPVEEQIERPMLKVENVTAKAEMLGWFWSDGLSTFSFFGERSPPPLGIFGTNHAGRMILIFPHWLPLVLFALLPMGWVFRYQGARRKARMHLCRACGYDLRATPDRCPECGTVPEKIKISN
jgi:hypothetical protein